MNAKAYGQRTVIRQKMAALQTMEEGSLTAEFRTGSAGNKNGRHYKHQVRRGAGNVSKRIPSEDAKPLGEAIANRQKFEALAADFIKMTVADPRQNYLPEGLKKRFYLPPRPGSRDCHADDPFFGRRFDGRAE